MSWSCQHCGGWDRDQNHELCGLPGDLRELGDRLEALEAVVNRSSVRRLGSMGERVRIRIQSGSERCSTAASGSRKVGPQPVAVEGGPSTPKAPAVGGS